MRRFTDSLRSLNYFLSKSPLDRYLDDFRRAMPDRFEFTRYIADVAATKDLRHEGIQRKGDHIWRKLGMQPGDVLFELGPGFGLLALKAALKGVHVTVLEHPDSHFLPSLQMSSSMLREAIEESGGTFHLIRGNIFHREVEQQLATTGPFDHIVALDVFRPDSNMTHDTARAQVSRLTGSLRRLGEVRTEGLAAGWAYFGIYEPKAVHYALKIILGLKNPHSGILYVNYTTSLERSRYKVDHGVLQPDFPFRDIDGIDDVFHELSLCYTSVERLPTTRNPLDAGKLYHFGQSST